MKTLFLIAPSEGKNAGGNYNTEKITFRFEKPIDIAINAREIDLKCKGERYKQGIELNENIESGPFLEAINRYSGVVYNNIDYKKMSDASKIFFDENVLILSGMYGILKPKDIIGNYKLPVETKGLYDFWGEKVVNSIAKINPDYIVNLLPDSYAKLIGIGKCSRLKKKRDVYLSGKTKIINLNFFHEKNGDLVKISHGVKKNRGQFIKKVCEQHLTNYEKFGGKIVNNGEIINIDIVE